MTISDFAALAIALPAMACDLRSARIPNGMLLGSAVLAFALQLRIGAAGTALLGAAVPLMLLMPLFYFRMMGAGDIKLFAVLGMLYGVGRGLLLIFITLYFAAIFSLGIVLARQNLAERFAYLYHYLCDYFVTREKRPYRRAFSPESELHLTVPVLMAVITLGGII